MALHCHSAPPSASSAALVQGPPAVGARPAPWAVAVGGGASAPVAALHCAEGRVWRRLAAVALSPGQPWTVALAAWTAPTTAVAVVSGTATSGPAEARVLRFHVPSSGPLATAECCYERGV